MICVLAHWLPQLEVVMFWSSISAFIVCLAAVLGMSKSKQPAGVVFSQYQNESGWPDGMSFLIGVGTCMYVFGATDAATHIAEACS
jgi:choline transport protein